MVEGYEVWHIECSGCGRKTTREGGNELVGTQARLRCRKCGHRGATLTRVWHVGKKKPGTKPG
jgi:DNA-directed RNA polymerase subunit RPC12/RpoP